MRSAAFAWLFLAAVSSSVEAAQSLDTSLERFKAELVNAYRQPDRERIRKLIHPKSIICLQTEPKYERYLLQAETNQALPPDAVVSVEPVDANTALPFRGFKFPLRPSHVVRMEFGKKVSSDGRSAITRISDKYISHSDNRWHLLIPCPTAEGLERLRDMGLLD